MIIAKLIEQLMGDSSEFEQITVFLSVDTANEARDLAHQIGVPLNRLLAELLPPAIVEARTEWRSLTHGNRDRGDPAETPSLSLKLPPHVK